MGEPALLTVSPPVLVTSTGCHAQHMQMSHGKEHHFLKNSIRRNKIWFGDHSEWNNVICLLQRAWGQCSNVFPIFTSCDIDFVNQSPGRHTQQAVFSNLCLLSEPGEDRKGGGKGSVVKQAGETSF